MKKELNIDADVQKLEEVLGFVDEILEEQDCFPKVQLQLDIAVEEIYVNIANYAYPGGMGKADITVEIGDAKELLKDWRDPEATFFSAAGEASEAVDALEGPIIILTFVDSGIPYDPLKKPDPDVTLSAEDRAIGGLGIFMVKKSMDLLQYKRMDEKNVFSLVKSL